MLTLDNYRDRLCPCCGSMLWLQSASMFMEDGIRVVYWVSCIKYPQCDINKMVCANEVGDEVT